MTVPAHLRYTRYHYWIRLEREKAVIGLTEFAIFEFGMIVFVEMPEAGSLLLQGQYAGEIETVQGEKDMLAPLSGRVTAVNTLLERIPQFLHDSPYDKGWMYELELSNSEELGVLLGAESYSDFV